MKAQIIALVLLFTSVFPDVYGQEQRISLSHDIEDSAHIMKLLNRAMSARYQSVDSAIDMAEQALQLSHLNRFKGGVAHSLLHLAEFMIQKNDFIYGKRLLYQAIPYCYGSSDVFPWLPHVMYNLLANVNMEQGYHDSAVHFYYLALAEIGKRKINDKRTLSIIYSNLGGILGNGVLNQRTQALYYLRKAAQLAGQMKDTQLLAGIYMNIGATYQNSSDIRDAVLIDTSLYYLNESLKLLKASHYAEKTRDAYSNIGRAYIELNDWQTAKRYFDSAVLADKEGAAEDISLLHHFAGYYSETGDYEQSLIYLKKSAAVAKRQNALSGLLVAYDRLAYVYDKMGRGHDAYEMQKAYSILKDSLLDSEKVASLNQAEVRYRTLEKDQQLTGQQLNIAQQENRLTKQRIWIYSIVGVAIGIILLGVFAFSWYRNQQKLKWAEMLHTEQQNEVAQLNAMMQGEEQERNRMARDLHDGMGVLLSAIKMNYAVLGKENETLQNNIIYQEGTQLINDMKDELHHIVHNMIPEMIARQNLAEALQVLAEHISKGGDTKIPVQVYGKAPQLAAEFNYNDYRKVEELMHNAVKHAMASRILVQLLFRDDNLHITVEDDGSGFDIKNKTSGMGLHNVRNRTTLLKGQLAIYQRNGGGTVAEIEIPYE